MRVDAAASQTARYGALGSTQGAPAVRARAAQADQGREARAPGRSEERVPQSQRIDELTQAEQRLVQALRNRDREVRAHELAHQAAGGIHAGGASFSYERGPDGRRYAVDGEVDVALRRTGDPERDLRMAEAVRRAALAPAEPSAQDQRIAARAAAIENEAQQALQEMAGVAQAHLGERAEAGRAREAEGTRRVEGEYIDRVSSRRQSATDDARQPQNVSRFDAVQGMGGAEFMAVGGRLDMYA